MRKITFLLLFLAFCTANAQSSWKKIESDNLSFRSNQLLERDTNPLKFDLFSLDLENFKKELTLKSRGLNKTIELPNHKGELVNYQVIESSNFTEPVAKEYGFITSYNIVNNEDQSETGKLSLGIDGVHITLYSGKRPTHYIDPYTKNNKTYISYSRANINKPTSNFECNLLNNVDITKSKKSLSRNANDGTLRSYRLALSCTGEYAQFHITRQDLSSATAAQQRAAVLSAMNTTMARVNGLFERDLAVHMNIVLIAGSNLLINLDPATDNLDNDEPNTLINQNQTLCDNVIGRNGYDIGHNFSTGGGGLAALGSICVNGSKGEGITGLPSPTGDSFDVDFVTHEFGHQFGGNHTFNGDTGNTAPIANAGADFSIPSLTPFALKGTASDIDGNNGLTYCWEQTDNEIVISPPSRNSTGGASFRSQPPSTSNTRYLPSLPTVILGRTENTWEVLPSFGRKLNFSLTVRDNQPGGGATDSDEMTITVTFAPPFKVTAPSTPVSWNGATTQTITWDKSATDQAPINCQNVRIKLSTDGGLTFDTVLIDSTPNDGSQDVVIPNLPTTEARIMVEAVDNIFFNVNSTNFTIVDNPTASVEDFSFSNFNLFPNPSNGRFNVSFDVLNTEKVKLRVFDFSGRLVENVAYKNVSNKFTTELDLEKLNSGLYLLQIENGNQQTTKKLIIK